MPKINVYLPDDLAAAVRAADLPISAICQKALAEAVRSVGAARRGIEALRDPRFDPDTLPQFASRVTDRMTEKLREAIVLARGVSPQAPHVRTNHLLIGILDQRENFAVRLLQTLEHDLDELREAARRVEVDEPLPAVPAAGAAGPRSAATGPGEEQSLWSGLTLPARIAIGAALEASIDLGHNYLGCEHLLIALNGDPDTGAGRVLHGAGLDGAGLRRAVVSASAGFSHARQNAPETDASRLHQILHRLDAIDRRLDAAGL
jgi:ATP-dependent Clp protease ATP-binding subunit ClpC